MDDPLTIDAFVPVPPARAWTVFNTPKAIARRNRGEGIPAIGPRDCPNARRDGRAAHPEASEGLLLPRLPRTAAHDEESPRGGDPAGLCSGHIHAVRR